MLTKGLGKLTADEFSEIVGRVRAAGFGPGHACGLSRLPVHNGVRGKCIASTDAKHQTKPSSTGCHCQYVVIPRLDLQRYLLSLLLLHARHGAEQAYDAQDVDLHDCLCLRSCGFAQT